MVLLHDKERKGVGPGENAYCINECVYLWRGSDDSFINLLTAALYQWRMSWFADCHSAWWTEWCFTGKALAFSLLGCFSQSWEDKEKGCGTFQLYYCPSLFDFLPMYLNSPITFRYRLTGSMERLINFVVYLTVQPAVQCVGVIQLIVVLSALFEGAGVVIFADISNPI